MKAGANQYSSPVINLSQGSQGKSREHAAVALNTSPSYVSDAKKLAAETPDLFQQVQKGELRIARGKFSQLKEQAKENILATQNNLTGAAFHNCEKLLPINTTQVLADELKTSPNTASRIIQIQAKAKNEIRF
jgi:hypothetical protein